MSGTGFDLAAKTDQLKKLENMMAMPNFWDNPKQAKGVVEQLSILKAIVVPANKMAADIEDIEELFQMAIEENDQQTLDSIAKDAEDLTKKCDEIELAGLLAAPTDMKNCFFSIHAGAGGTESCDWVQMLMRMYVRYFERNGFKFSELDLTAGEEAGIRSVTLNVKGKFAFGKLSCETGVHRLVRISPFDSQKRRHTSFAAVDVIPEFDDDIDIEIKDEDIRVDYYRASGAGGQHVNKTSSAVRITHLETSIVVQCQSGRSQHKNKAQAMKMLKSRLYMLEQQKRDSEIARLYGNKGEIAWGSQIRSYVMQPYQMVKDHRTDYQVGNVAAIMDGDIEGFIESYLKYKAKKSNKNKSTIK